MRRKSAGNLRRRAGKNHDDLAAPVEASEVVVIFLGDFEAVAGEDQRRFHLRSRHHAQADDGILAKGYGFVLAVANKRQAAIFLDDLSRDKFDWLIKAVCAGGLGSSLFELLDGIGFWFSASPRASVSGLAALVRGGL